jgi:putative serine protease PepD
LATRVWLLGVPAAAGALLAAGTAGYVVGSRDDGAGGSDGACVASDVAADALPAVVTIRATTQAGTSSGSGEVIRPDGYVMTNNHVISGAATSGLIDVVLDDGTTKPARIVGRDPDTDLAVLKVEGESSLRTIQFGRSSRLRVGQPVVALGAPLGLESSVTSGIVSALDRTVQVPADNGRSALLLSAIQTDAAINPGNSGGALVDCDGELVGVPTAGATISGQQGGGGSIGIGFAIPSEFAESISDELIDTGRVTHSFIGIQAVPISAARARPADVEHGLFVVATTPGGPAAAAGVRADDIVTEVDGRPAITTQQLQQLTLTNAPGGEVELTHLRAGRQRRVTLTLGARASP